MKVISIVDDDYGIMFNNRRVSKDSVLNEHIIKMLDGRKLWLYGVNFLWFEAYCKCKS